MNLVGFRRTEIVPEPDENERCEIVPAFTSTMPSSAQAAVEATELSVSQQTSL